MKKLILLLLILSVKLSAQTPFSLRAPLQQVYKTGSVNDTTIQKFSADSALWQTTKSRFKFNKQIHAPLMLIGTDTASTKAYVRSLIGVESDPVWVLAQPYYVTRAELGDTANSIRAAIGSETVYSYAVSANATTTIILGTTASDLIDVSNYIIKLTSHYQSGNAKIMLKGSSLYINSGQTIDTNGGAGIGISITFTLSGSDIQMNIINSTAETGTVKLTIKRL